MGGGGGQQLFPGAEAGVDQAPVGQCLERRFILRRPAALLVRDLPGLPAQVPVQPKPVQIVRQLVEISGLAAVWVQVLHPQQHFPTQGPDVQPGQQRGK